MTAFHDARASSRRQLPFHLAWTPQTRSCLPASHETTWINKCMHLQCRHVHTVWERAKHRIAPSTMQLLDGQQQSNIHHGTSMKQKSSHTRCRHCMPGTSRRSHKVFQVHKTRNDQKKQKRAARSPEIVVGGFSHACTSIWFRCYDIVHSKQCNARPSEKARNLLIRF